MKELGVLFRPGKFFFFIPFLLVTILCFGQRARLFTTDSELSNSLIGGIYQDHKGIIWIVTEDGINRYDGSKFTIYKEKDGILNNYARLIFEDSKNNLYFGFYNGLQIYDHASDSFERIPLILSDKTDFPAHVLCMLERRNGTILVSTSGQGVFSVSLDGGKTVAHQMPEIVPSYFVNYLFEDINQNLWISTQDKGLFRVGEEKQPKNYFNPKQGLDSNISSICQDQDGNLYVGSLSKGLFKYNNEKDFFVQISQQGLLPSPIMVLYPIQTNRLLIGTDGEGMKLYDPVKNQISNLNFNVSNFDFSKSKVHAIMKDNDGNFWLGLFQKGVALIPSRINNFKYMGYQSVTNNIIGSNYIMSVYEDHEKTLWVGTDSDGLYSVSPEGEQIAHYTHSIKNNSAPSTIMCIHEDSNNNLWIGSYFKGLAKLDRETGIFEYVRSMLNDQSIPVQRIYSITEDNQKNLWIGTLGFGLYSMNLKSGVIKNYSETPNSSHQNNAANTLHNNWINCLLITRDEKLYVGTADGISCLDLKTKTFTTLNDSYPELRVQIVQTMYQDSLGRIWIGTSHGLMYLKPEKQVITTYTTDDGLPSDVICGIESDDNQNLWISTNYGISKFNPESETFVNYYFHDGLQGNEFSKRAAFKGDNGRIFFGGINGVTYFKPADIKDNVKNLDVMITGFYIHDDAIKKGMKSGKYDIINTSVMDADTFNLSYKDNSFSIEFSAMEYVNPKRITYLYSIDDENWITLQRGTNTVAFNNLNPGEYNFKVKAKDFSTYSDVKEVTIILHPAWYFSTWAKTGYFLITIMIITGVAFQIMQRHKTRKRMREHQHAKQINEAKLEFFTNISHEIRTPLSLILNPLKKLITSDLDAGRQKAYKLMRRNTERILHLVDQLMDLRKIDNGKISLKFRETDIIKFIHEVTEIFEEQIFAKHILFQIHYMPGIPNVWIDQNFFDKTIQNLLSNAIKFTPEYGEIHLFIETHDVLENGNQPNSHLKITCSDNGIGLPESEQGKIFDRFYQASNSQSHSVGSGIGLHLTRSIVELHLGTIHAENNPDGPGCRFIISIPLGKKHLDPDEIEINHFEIEGNKINRTILDSPLEGNEDASVKSKSKKNVLVVDDDEEVRQYICNELASEYHMYECANGKEALTHALAQKPDLVISDIMMPEMDGMTLCHKIKHNVNINHIPVILLTAKYEEKDNLEGLGIGADAYISKPFNMEILKKTAENIIKNRDLLKHNFSGNQLQSDKVKNIEIKSADEKLIQRVMNVINNNIDNPDLNVEMIALEIGISRVHLYRKLKELTNQSVRDLIRNIRLGQAAELLSTKNLNISEVAYATGFSNPSKFSTSFKELYGISPKNYMETNRNKIPDHSKL